MRRSSLAFMIIRAIAAITMAYFLAVHHSNQALWIRITFVVLVLTPIVVDAIRTYRFYQRTIKPGRRYN